MFVEASGNKPAADLNGNITVQPGSRLPGIPAHQLKVGASYKVTDKWTLGANLVAASRVVEVFARARNVTNSWYYNFGTCSATSSVAIVQAPSYSLAAPASIFAGVRITF